ncbi:class I tRNA ligase family protein [Streptomyces alfalfae]|uniref:valine--tRNA ligase n=1 Tax=Streptomyces alfalfae TaxID=1642299 RepID=A0ABM6GNA3_9ACTN|nr:class I tRNA ligase family protein [Streptomyces alfalfae]APY85263.1 hypothetical protein A7J05_05575 [Streptomyces alfalfae]
MAFIHRRTGVPDRPVLDGLEDTWSRRWDESGVYAFDRSKTRDEVFSIDTPPPTVSGSLHVGHVFSYTHTDAVARYQRMRGKEVFYPMGWDDNGLPTERRVQNHFGVRCDPSLPYDPGFTPPKSPGKRQLPISRRNFIELCERLTVEGEKVFAARRTSPRRPRCGMSPSARRSSRPNWRAGPWSPSSDTSRKVGRG